ncbi:branched-chain amino acid aminotransferase [Qipengyuania sediminis]|uniref:branched-chain amino acid aminotransferase n=1 Tax=Qipengyuania sediminis TaxID=1532023 RepID=UPI001059ED87|nr:branched-chain amino acid aminotransferase [Qipengyuania sediminis]
MLDTSGRADILSFTTVSHPAPVPADVRSQAIASPRFGTVFTDHMVIIDYDADRGGWHRAQLTPRAPLQLDPATSVLHYAQEIFEGLKAYRHPDGSIALFRPAANAARFNDSARRMAMPELPEALFLDALRRLVEIDREWVQGGDGASLYLRPFMFASEAFLGVRPARQFKFVVIASPAGAYFKSGQAAVKIWVSRDYVRAAPGGTGAAKTGGNYAASLVPQAEGIAEGCDQVVFLDAAQRRWIEELGGMNLFFVFADGSVVTPPLTGTILAGITRDSLLTLLREEGLSVREEPYSINQWRADAMSGHLTETLACGTAAVVSSVGTVLDTEGAFTIGSGSTGQVAHTMREVLTGIQTGRRPDPYGWVMKL